jgi:predicted MFS family arabinose efflux permease
MGTAKTLISRNFVLAFAAQMGLMSVYQLLIPTLPLYLKRLGSSEIELGVLVGAMGISSVVTRPIVGKVLDKVGARLFLMIGASVYVVATAAYLLFPPFWPLLFVRILHGGAFGLFHTASTSYAVSITDTNYRARVLAYFALTMNFAGAIMPPLGVAVLNHFGPPHLFFLCLCVAVSMLVVTATLGRNHAAPSIETTANGSSFLSRGAIPHSLVGFMALWVWASLTTFYPIYATNRGVANPGLFFTAMAITLIASRTLGGKLLDAKNKRVLVRLCLATSVLSMIVLSLSKTQPMFLLSGVIWSMGHAFLIPSLMTLAMERSNSAPSSIVATFYTVSDIGVFLGPLVMGVVIHYSSYPTMFFCLSLVGLGNLLYFWVLQKPSRS